MNDLENVLNILYGAAFIADAVARPVELGEGTVAHAAQLRNLARELRKGALVVSRVMSLLDGDDDDETDGGYSAYLDDHEGDDHV
jgi:hypothetical protein